MADPWEERELDIERSFVGGKDNSAVDDHNVPPAELIIRRNQELTDRLNRRKRAGWVNFPDDEP